MKIPAVFFAFLSLPLTLSLPAAENHSPSPVGWPPITSVNKPWAYWHWLGNAVNPDDISALLKTYRDADMGGMHIIPIYGVKGCEEKFIDFLTPKWMEMLAHTTTEAQKLGMGIDMTTGTGWPFGGPWVPPADAAACLITKSWSLDASQSLSESLPEGTPLIIQACCPDGRTLDLTDTIAQQKLNWSPPEGQWTIYALFLKNTGQIVKRAAPGDVGPVVDPFSPTALNHYLEPFTSVFQNYSGPKPRSQYHDSYEYYGANWTQSLFDEFQKRRGYDLRQQLPAFFGNSSPEHAARVRGDYCRTIGELHLGFIEQWVRWSHEQGFQTRNQAHGAPANILDIYAAADIPETEIYGPSGFAIPGLTKDTAFNNELPDPLMLKFASSAAHVSGKPLVASETCTWLAEHFQISLAQAKPEIDQGFICGINHIFYHGMPYSPPGEPWPGWLFYASTNFNPNGVLWKDLPALNQYIARCQSILQSGRPANDILLYFPIHDMWHLAVKNNDRLNSLAVHNLDEWLRILPFYHSARKLWNLGFTFDYISDRQIEQVQNSPAGLSVGGSEYKTILIPFCRWMPLSTLKTLLTLAENGATILIQGNLPQDVPGWHDLENRRQEFRALLRRIQMQPTKNPAIQEASIGKGRIFQGIRPERLLKYIEIAPETMANLDIRFIRRTHEKGLHYFLTNLSNLTLNQWVPLAAPAVSVMILDPRFESRFGKALLQKNKDNQTSIYLQLEPGQSCILRTFTNDDMDAPPWPYYPKGVLETPSAGLPIEGTWNVMFLEGGPELPPPFETSSLASWTLQNNPQTKTFAGTAKYSLTFTKPATFADDWMLDLGKVCHSARVTLNGQFAGTAFSFPFKVPVGQYLREGENLLEIEVTNLAANRIADLDRRGVPWKKFYDINIVNIRYAPFDASGWPLMDSGLLGPVRLLPMQNTMVN